MRRGRAGGLALLVAATGACAPGAGVPVRPPLETLAPASPLRSTTLRDSDAWLRHYLISGEHPRASEALAKGSPLAPRDGLVRALQEGVILHQAGDHRGSNAALERAEGEAERRITRSISRAVGAMVVNDGVMAYTPPPAELAMLPYYRMLNYLALGDRTAALVEARKANALLAHLSRDPSERCGGDGLLHYLAGLIQHSAGELNDAVVSLRHAERSFSTCQADGGEGVGVSVGTDLYRAARALGVQEIADSVATRYRLEPNAGSRGGELLLLVEHGFVAHRAEQAFHVPISGDDLEGLESGDEEGVASIAARIASRLLDDRWERNTHERYGHDDGSMRWSNAPHGAYLLRLAWPELRLAAARPAGVRVRVDDAPAAVARVGDLSAAMQSELEARRGAILARLVARGITKYLLSREMEKSGEKKGGEVVAYLVRRLTNLAANRLEQADLRSWSLLPDRISMLRTHLPPGPHRVRIETLDRSGEVVTTHDLGEVVLREGELVVLSRRIWGDDEGELRAPGRPASYAGIDSLRTEEPPVRLVDRPATEQP